MVIVRIVDLRIFRDTRAFGLATFPSLTRKRYKKRALMSVAGVRMRARI